ncbi:hypothetical protein EDD21DRAFT_387250 [Dissophora ornata]|nr:hypothetical protein EDD21DRAFT_387250 [Dissophora ornata]
MSQVTTLLTWLIPCLVIIFAFVAWRVYVYRTRGPVLPSYIPRNLFARSRSMIPRTLSFSSNKDVPLTNTAATGPTMAIRNETRIGVPGQQEQQQQKMSSIPSNRTADAQSYAPVPCEKKKVIAPVSPVTPDPQGSIPSSGGLAKPATSPAVSRLLAMK